MLSQHLPAKVSPRKIGGFTKECIRGENSASWQVSWLFRSPICLPTHNDGAVTSGIRDFPASRRIGTTVAGQLPLIRTRPKPVRSTEFPFHPAIISMLTGHQNDYGKERHQRTECKVENLGMRVKCSIRVRNVCHDRA